MMQSQRSIRKKNRKKRNCCRKLLEPTKVDPSHPATQAKVRRRNLRKAYIRGRLKELNKHIHPHEQPKRPTRSDVLRRLPMIELILNLILVFLSCGFLFWCLFHSHKSRSTKSVPVLKEFLGIFNYIRIFIIIACILTFLTGAFGYILSFYGMKKIVWLIYRGFVLGSLFLITGTAILSVSASMRPLFNHTTPYFLHSKKDWNILQEKLKCCGINGPSNDLNETSPDDSTTCSTTEGIHINICQEKIQKIRGEEKNGYVKITLFAVTISCFLHPILLYLANLQEFVDGYHPLFFYYTTREKYRFQGINEPILLYRYLEKVPPNLRTPFEKKVMFWLEESFKTRRRLEKYGIRPKENNKEQGKLKTKTVKERNPARSISTRRGYDPNDTEGSGYATPSPSEENIMKIWDSLYDTTYHNRNKEYYTSHSLIMFRAIDENERCALEFEIRKSDPSLPPSELTTPGGSGE